MIIPQVAPCSLDLHWKVHTRQGDLTSNALFQQCLVQGKSYRSMLQEMYDPGLKGSRPEINSCKALPVSERGISSNLYLLPCKFVTSMEINASAMAEITPTICQQSVTRVSKRLRDARTWCTVNTSMVSSIKLRRKTLGLSMIFPLSF